MKQLISFFILAILIFSQSFSEEYADFFDKICENVYPQIYGDIVDAFSKTAKETSKEFYDELSKLNQYISRITAGISIAGSIYKEDYSDASLTAVLTAITEFFGTQKGKTILAAYGLSSLTVNLAVGAFQVWLESRKALYESEVASKLEHLYFKIETDPNIKNKNRRLGEGEPIKLDAVDYVWKKIITDSTWRELFKVYYTEELKQEWPSLSLWDKWTAGWYTNIESLEIAELESKKKEIKQNIVGLLSYMNKIAKKREAEVVLLQHLTLLSKIDPSDPKFKNFIDNYTNAVNKIPEVEKFIKDAHLKIDDAKKSNNLYVIKQIIEQCDEYGRTVIAYLPTKGTYAAQRSQLFSELSKIRTEAINFLKYYKQKKDELKNKTNLTQEEKDMIYTGSLADELLVKTSSQEKEILKTTDELKLKQGTGDFIGLENIPQMLIEFILYEEILKNTKKLKDIKLKEYPFKKINFVKLNQSANLMDFCKRNLEYINSEINYLENNKLTLEIKRIEETIHNIDSLYSKRDLFFDRKKEIEAELTKAEDYIKNKNLSQNYLQNIANIKKQLSEIENFYNNIQLEKRDLENKLKDINDFNQQLESDINYLIYLKSYFIKLNEFVNKLYEIKINIVKVISSNGEILVLSKEKRDIKSGCYSAEEIKSLIDTLSLNYNQLLEYGVDKKHQLGIEDALNQQYLREIKNIKGIQNFHCIDSIIITNEDLKNLKEIYQNIQVDINFLQNIQSTKVFELLKSKNYNQIWLSNVVVYKVETDRFQKIINFSWEVIKRIVNETKNEIIKNQTQELISIIDEKIKNYNKFLEEKENIYKKFEDLYALIYNAFYNASNKDNSENVDFWKKVVSYESNLEEFINKYRNSSTFVNFEDSIDKLKNMIYTAKEMIRNLENRRKEPSPEDSYSYEEQNKIKMIKDMYKNFSLAYEKKDHWSLLSFLDENWQCFDGTDFNEVSETIKKIFNTFDEFKYKITNIEVKKIEKDRYKVSYNLEITSRIYKNNSTYKEHSFLEEEVVFKNNSPKIFRTLSGRFWFE